MRRWVMLALLLWGSVQLSFAADAPPSDASLHQLLDVVQAHKLLDGVMPQVDAMMRASAESALAGRKLDAGQQRIMDGQLLKMHDLMKEDITWEKMEPMYMDVYRKSFSQKEVDDMLTFYRSPSGQAVIAKLPVVMQQSMQMMQVKLKVLMPKIQRISEETVAELRAYDADKQ